MPYRCGILIKIKGGLQEDALQVGRSWAEHMYESTCSCLYWIKPSGSKDLSDTSLPQYSSHIKQAINLCISRFHLVLAGRLRYRSDNLAGRLDLDRMFLESELQHLWVSHGNAGKPDLKRDQRATLCSADLRHDEAESHSCWSKASRTSTVYISHVKQSLHPSHTACNQCYLDVKDYFCSCMCVLCTSFWPTLLQGRGTTNTWIGTLQKIITQAEALLTTHTLYFLWRSENIIAQACKDEVSTYMYIHEEGLNLNNCVLSRPVILPHAQQIGATALYLTQGTRVWVPCFISCQIRWHDSHPCMTLQAFTLLARACASSQDMHCWCKLILRQQEIDKFLAWTCFSDL